MWDSSVLTALSGVVDLRVVTLKNGNASIIRTDNDRRGVCDLCAREKGIRENGQYTV